MVKNHVCNVSQSVHCFKECSVRMMNFNETESSKEIIEILSRKELTPYLRCGICKEPLKLILGMDPRDCLALDMVLKIALLSSRCGPLAPVCAGALGAACGIVAMQGIGGFPSADCLATWVCYRAKQCNDDCRI